MRGNLIVGAEEKERVSDPARVLVLSLLLVRVKVRELVPRRAYGLAASHGLTDQHEGLDLGNLAVSTDIYLDLLKVV